MNTWNTAQLKSWLKVSKDQVVTAILLAGLGIMLGCVALVAMAGLWGWRYWTTFSSETGLTFSQLKNDFSQGWSQSELATTQNHIVFLILGLDQIANRDQVTGLTDTIMLASLNTATGRIALLSLPRDLWLEAYQTKINALYYYGWQQQPAQPTLFPTQVISELTNVPISRTVVVSLDSIAELVDIIGGVEINVPEAFVDTQYPRSDVVLENQTDVDALYTTVSFAAGPQHLDGARVLEYIRSRKSQGEQGTDDSRTHRQQQVMIAVLDRIKTGRWWQNPSTSAQLFMWYQRHFSSQLSLPDVISLSKQLLPTISQLTFSTHSLPTDLLTQPPVNPARYQGQWVYLVADLEAFQASTSATLLMQHE